MRYAGRRCIRYSLATRGDPHPTPQPPPWSSPMIGLPFHPRREQLSYCFFALLIATTFLF